MYTLEKEIIDVVYDNKITNEDFMNWLNKNLDNFTEGDSLHRIPTIIKLKNLDTDEQAKYWFNQWVKLAKSVRTPYTTCQYMPDVDNFNIKVVKLYKNGVEVKRQLVPIV